MLVRLAVRIGPSQCWHAGTKCRVFLPVPVLTTSRQELRGHDSMPKETEVRFLVLKQSCGLFWIASLRSQ